FLGAGGAAPSPGVSGVVGSIFFSSISSICVTFCPPAGGASLYRNSHGGFSAVFLVLQAARTADRRGRVNRFAADAKFINQVMGVGGKADGISLDNVLPFLHLNLTHAEEIALDAAAMVDDYGAARHGQRAGKDNDAVLRRADNAAGFGCAIGQPGGAPGALAFRHQPCAVGDG